MLRQFSRRRILGFFMFDWLGTLVMLGLAAILRARLGSLPYPLGELLLSLDIPVGQAWPIGDWRAVLPLHVFFLVGALWPASFSMFAVYDGRRNATLRAELTNVASTTVAVTLILAGTLYFTYSATPRLLFLLFFLLDIVLLLSARVGLWVYRRSRRGVASQNLAPVLVVGAGRVGRAVAEQLRKYACADLSLIGYADDNPAEQGRYHGGLAVLGTLDDIECIVVERRVRNAVVALPLEAHDRLVEVCRRLQRLDVRVHVIPDLFALSFPGATLDGFGGIPVIDLGQPSIHGWRRALKRASDIVIVTLILAVLWPLLALIAALIKHDSPGPAIYKQTRVGENGRLFTMYKFRSMRADADTSSHQQYVTRLITQNLGVVELGANGDGHETLKMAGDPRITRAGRLIRKTSLDELPQLLNVLRGEMSLVGPRPPIPYEVEVYQDWHRRRLEAIPGITGLWQVEGRNMVSFDEMVRLDIKYIEQQSFWLDLAILAKTPLAVLAGRGAG